MKKVFLLAGILMLLSACAEDKSNDSGTNSYQVTGKVIYTADNFKSAKVCVDANNNGLADDAYCTETANDGSYSFTSSDSISSYPLAASITTANTAVNARLNNGKILMYAPKGKADVISIETTLIKSIMEQNSTKTKVTTVIKNILKDRAFVVMSLLGCLLMAVQMYTNTVNLYLFKDYFQNSSINTVYMVVSYAPMVIMMPFVNKMIQKFGKKEICVTGLAISTVASFLTYALQIGKDNVWTFIILAVFVNIGIGFLTLEVWAMAADIIDHQEWKTGHREEASNYAIFTFMRKVGQAIAALAPWFVGLAGYDSTKAGTGISQGEEVLRGMYNAATIVPAVLFAVMLVLAVLYPLNKKTTQKMHEDLTKKHESMYIETV